MFKFRASPVFVSDGCSGYLSVAWRWLTGGPPPWEGCCRSHDALYWCGGKALNGPCVDSDTSNWDSYRCKVTRRQADDLLFDCVASHSRVWAWLCWLAVRVGGSQYLPFSWRWRYRENYFDVIRGVRP